MSNPIKTPYVVTGYAFIPVEVQIWCDAETPQEAMELSRRLFNARKSDSVVRGSEDYSAAFDFEPSSAMPPVKHEFDDEDVPF